MRNLMHKRTIDPNSFITSSGSRKKKVYGPRYDGKKLTLIETGEIDIQDEINSHAMECDMSFILSRLANGDTSVLNNKQPIFADFRQMPSNFREILDVALNAERIFNQLDPDTRRQFDNDYRQFVYNFGTADWNKIMGGDNNANQPEGPNSGEPGSDPE